MYRPSGSSRSARLRRADQYGCAALILGLTALTAAGCLGVSRPDPATVTDAPAGDLDTGATEDADAGRPDADATQDASDAEPPERDAVTDADAPSTDVDTLETADTIETTETVDGDALGDAFDCGTCSPCQLCNIDLGLCELDPQQMGNCCDTDKACEIEGLALMCQPTCDLAQNVCGPISPDLKCSVCDVAANCQPFADGPCETAACNNAGYCEYEPISNCAECATDADCSALPTAPCSVHVCDTANTGVCLPVPEPMLCTVTPSCTNEDVATVDIALAAAPDGVLVKVVGEPALGFVVDEQACENQPGTGQAGHIALREASTGAILNTYRGDHTAIDPTWRCEAGCGMDDCSAPIPGVRYWVWGVYRSAASSPLGPGVPAIDTAQVNWCMEMTSANLAGIYTGDLRNSANTSESVSLQAVIVDGGATGPTITLTDPSGNLTATVSQVAFTTFNATLEFNLELSGSPWAGTATAFTLQGSGNQLTGLGGLSSGVGLELRLTRTN